jgi:hypothetical protein
MAIEVAAHKFLLFRPHRSRLAAKFTDEKVRELQQRKEQEAVEVHF